MVIIVYKKIIVLNRWSVILFDVMKILNKYTIILILNEPFFFFNC